MDGSAIFAGPQIKPIGGNIMAHASTTRFVKPSFSISRCKKFEKVPCLVGINHLTKLMIGLHFGKEEGRSGFVK